jgi:uncharacterized protein Yka (UPF0111/DUF47 family)
MSLLSKLVPKEVKFFDLFNETALKIREGLDEFQLMLKNPDKMEEHSRRLKVIEHETDEIVHGTIDLLNSTFITPIDREDIQNLVKKMDDVIDLAQGASQRLWLYEIKTMHPDLPKLAAVLGRAFAEVQGAVNEMKDLRNINAIKKHCIEINRLENEGDFIISSAVANLFKDSTDALYVMKWKEIFEIVEAAVDSCEDVANVIESVVVKQG